MHNEPIWVVQPTVEDLNALHENTAIQALGIVMTEIGADFLQATMPVEARTRQPFGLLHGGAAVLLLETLASAAANHCVDLNTHMCVGLEINCNHVRGVTAGTVTGRAQALHIGSRTMIWQLQNTDEQGRLVTTGRLTSAVLPRPAAS